MVAKFPTPLPSRKRLLMPLGERCLRLPDATLSLCRRPPNANTILCRGLASTLAWSGPLKWILFYGVEGTRGSAGACSTRMHSHFEIQNPMTIVNDTTTFGKLGVQCSMCKALGPRVLLKRGGGSKGGCGGEPPPQKTLSC